MYLLKRERKHRKPCSSVISKVCASRVIRNMDQTVTATLPPQLAAVWLRLARIHSFLNKCRGTDEINAEKAPSTSVSIFNLEHKQGLNQPKERDLPDHLKRLVTHYVNSKIST